MKSPYRLDDDLHTLYLKISHDDWFRYLTLLPRRGSIPSVAERLMKRFLSLTSDLTPNDPDNERLILDAIDRLSITPPDRAPIPHPDRIGNKRDERRPATKLRGDASGGKNPTSDQSGKG